MEFDSLPARPDLEQLRRQAKDLSGAARGGDVRAISRLSAHLPAGTRITLSAAQLVLARELGYPSWPQLKASVESRDRDVGKELTLPATPPFRVFGVTAPVLAPALLGEFHRVNGRCEQIGLLFGAATVAHGPFAYVLSAKQDAHSNALDRVLADERDRLWNYAGLDEPAPADAQLCTVELTVDGVPAKVELRREAHTWAARGRFAADVIVTVVARGIDADQLRLSTVQDLQPFQLERDAEIERRRAGATMVRPEVLDIAPAEGTAAHAALIGLCLPDLSPHPRRRDGQEMVRAWEAATRAQMLAAGQQRPAATAAVTSMVNQATALAEQATWFADSRLRDRAIDEITRSTAYGAVVASGPAQRQWQQLWNGWYTLQQGESPPSHERLMARSDDEGAWLSSWQRWSEAAGTR